MECVGPLVLQDRGGLSRGKWDADCSPVNMQKEENKSLMVARDLPCKVVRVSTLTSLFRLWVLRWTHWLGFCSCRSLFSSINPPRDFHPHGWAPVRLKIVLLTDGGRLGCCEHKLSCSPGEPEKVQFTCSYCLYPSAFTHLCSCCKAWLVLRLNEKPLCLHVHPTMLIQYRKGSL